MIWIATAAGLGMLAGCLPHGALGGQAEAIRYTLQLRGDERAEEWSAVVQWARAFEDGSNGWLVCLRAAPWTESAEPSSATCLELRNFSTGEVLEVRGLDGLTGGPHHFEALDALWPVLSPRIVPSGQVGVTSWPLARVGGRPVRSVATGSWSREAGARRWRWTASVEVAAPVSATAELTAGVELSPDGRVERASWRWAAAAEGRAPRVDGEITRAGPAPAIGVQPCSQRGESPSRAPLCLPDGRPVDGRGRSVAVDTLFAGRPTLLQSKVEPQP